MRDKKIARWSGVPRPPIVRSRRDLFNWRLKWRWNELPDFPHFAKVLLHRDDTTPLYRCHLIIFFLSAIFPRLCHVFLQHRLVDLDEICSSGEIFRALSRGGPSSVRHSEANDRDISTKSFHLRIPMSRGCTFRDQVSITKSATRYRNHTPLIRRG